MKHKMLRKIIVQLDHVFSESNPTAVKNGLSQFIYSKTIQLIGSRLGDLIELVFEWSKQSGSVYPLIIEHIIITSSHDVVPTHDAEKLEALVLSAFTQTTALATIIPHLTTISTAITPDLSPNDERSHQVSSLFKSQRSELLKLCEHRSNAIQELLEPLQSFKKFIHFSSLSSQITSQSILSGMHNFMINVPYSMFHEQLIQFLHPNRLSVCREPNFPLKLHPGVPPH